MTSEHLLAMLLTVAVAGLTTDMDCPKYIPGQMPCEKTQHKLYVKAGDSLILNCTCFNKTNGQWTGPNKLPSSATDHYMPYTHGTYLNPSLNKSKYKVLGGYEDTKCYLRIMNFLSNDDGTYMCQYFISSTIYIDVYKIVATYYVGDTSAVNHDGKNTKTEIYTFETKSEEVSDKKFLSLEWMLPLIVIIITFGVVTTVLLWRRKDKSESTISWIEDIEENTQGESVENRLYRASEILEINNRQGHNRISQNQVLSSSQIHTDDGYNGVNATDPVIKTRHTRRANLSQGVNSQTNGRNMHYAEVSFEVKHPTHRFVIHGKDDRTVYSEIDHSIRAERLPSSSSESEDN